MKKTFLTALVWLGFSPLTLASIEKNYCDDTAAKVISAEVLKAGKNARSAEVKFRGMSILNLSGSPTVVTSEYGFMIQAGGEYSRYTLQLEQDTQNNSCRIRHFEKVDGGHF